MSIRMREQPAVVLSYMPRKRTPWRVILASILFVPVAFAGKWVWPAVSHQYGVLNRQHRCVAYKPSANEVIWRNGSAPLWVGSVAPSLAAFIPDISLKYGGPFKEVSGTFAFTGVLRNKHGERLVMIECGECGHDGNMDNPPDLVAHVIRPATFLAAPVEIWCSDIAPAWDYRLTLPAIPPVPGDGLWHPPERVLVGCRDADDPSGFLIPYTMSLASSYLIGRLRDDDHVEVRDASGTGLWNDICASCSFPNDD
jgi:hypothetical protein